MEEIEKILKILKRDFSGKREPTGKEIEEKTHLKMEELRKEGLSKEELEVLKVCYETEYNDSNSSIASSLAIIGVVVSIVVFIAGITEFAKSLETCIYIIFKFLYVALIVVYIFLAFSKIITNSNESAKLRNNILAVNLLLMEMEEKKKESVPSMEVSQHKDEARNDETNNKGEQRK